MGMLNEAFTFQELFEARAREIEEISREAHKFIKRLSSDLKHRPQDKEELKFFLLKCDALQNDLARVKSLLKEVKVSFSLSKSKSK